MRIRENLGKNFYKKEYLNFNITGGTVNHKDVKSIWIDLESYAYFENSCDIDDVNILIKNWKHQLKRKIINEIDTEIFHRESIVEFTFRYNYKPIEAGRKSYFLVEINLYTKKHINIKDIEFNKYISTFTHKIIDDILVDNEIIKFVKLHNN